jgi:PadR family transcriptional regulator, regulatory protein PadR
MRRRAGDLLPLEAKILCIAKIRAERGQPVFHGWSIGPPLEEVTGQDVPLGTRYRTLDRLETLGYLASEWGQPEKPGLPPRRLYRITPAGLEALASARRTPVGSKPSRTASPLGDRGGGILAGEELHKPSRS